MIADTATKAPTPYWLSYEPEQPPPPTEPPTTSLARRLAREARLIAARALARTALFAAVLIVIHVLHPAPIGG